MKQEIGRRLRRELKNFQDYFFPKNCLNCGKEGSWLCESCKNSLFFIEARFCPFCHKPSDLYSVCEHCQKESKVNMIFSFFKYNDFLVRKIIKNFKYRYIKDIAEDITPIVRKFIIKYKNLIDFEDAVLIPVPLHRKKERERGFNQAEIIALIISNILSLELNKKCVKKHKKSKNQAELDMGARFNNLSDVFKATGPAPKKVIIVDDVFTTGATIKEVARVLFLNGTEKIQVITLARG